MIKNQFYNIVSKVDDLFSSTNNLTEIMNLIEFEGVRKYFFYNLLSQKGFKLWLIPLKNAGFFDIKKHPKNKDSAPYTPYWDVLEYLKKVSEECESNDILFVEIKSIIDPIIEIADSLNNFRTDYYMMQIISTLPIEMIEDKYFQFTKQAFNRDSDLIASAIHEKLIPKLLKHESRINMLKLIRVILSYKIKSKLSLTNDIDEAFSILGDYQLTEIIAKYKDDIISLCGYDIIDVIIDIMKDLINVSPSAFNHIWIPAIEDHPQTSFRDRYDCQITYMLRDTLESFDSDELKPVVDKLLNEQHYIFKRVAIHIINFKYNELNDLFWSRDWNPIDEVLLKHEVYELLKNNSMDISSLYIAQLIKWIETAKYYEDDNELTIEQKNKFTAYTKKEWYSSLVKSGNPEIIQKYNEYNEINPSKLDHPGFNSWIETRFGGAPSPLTSEQINEMKISQLVDYLADYKGEKDLMGESLSLHGIDQAFRQAVSNNPMHYINNIFKFDSIPNRFHYNLISGFKDALDKNKNAISEYDLLIDYLWKTVLKEDIKNYSDDAKHYNLEADILRMTGWLIGDILRSEEISLSENNLSQVESVLLDVESLIKTKSKKSDNADVISLVLNSPRGIIYDDLMLYSLKYERIKKSSDEFRWKDSIKSLFNNVILNSADQTVEFYTILGEYLSQLYYLDSDWVKTNVKLIFPDDNQEFWNASFTGYLYRSNRVYKEIFDLLKSNNYYSKAIMTNFKGKYSAEQLVRHVLVSYINDWESISDKSSLINLLLDTSGIEYYRTIVNFIRASRDYLTDSDKKAKVKDLWRNLLSRYFQIIRDREYDVNEINNEAISELLDWLVVFDNIDDVVLECTINSIKFAKKNFRIHFLIENLNKFIDKQPDVVAKIFITLIEAGNIPTYQDDEIKILVEKLYDLNQKEYADLICNKYGEEGFYFLRETYFANQRN